MQFSSVNFSWIHNLHVPHTVIVYAIWNTTAGRDYPGQCWYEHSPNNAFDENWSSAFCTYGETIATVNSELDGLNTAVYLTLPGDPVQLQGICFV